ncbi:MAG: RpiB/LacA/LacB family sugar-phosphate isomerase [Christensenellaceae bacterium]|jgi:ribose 5-phosphate isomerase B|nr:RpiB/LacA/LacB family sugar-phosphate isomerase [Christensenellaceae bacterium]
MSEKIIIGADHAGFELKEKIKSDLIKKGFNVIDVGADTLDPEDGFPPFGARLSQEVLAAKSRGIIICGSGIGVSIAVNRFKGIYGAKCDNVSEVITARKHNHANVLCLGARLITEAATLEMVKAFLETSPDVNPKYLARMREIDELC